MQPDFQGGPGRTATPPVGFGPASSPLAQVRPQPISRAATPGGPPSVTSPPPGELHSSGGRSPFAGQPAPGQVSPGPAAPQGMGPGYRLPTGQPPMSGRVTSPLARSAASMVPPNPATGPTGGYANVARPMAPPTQQQPPYQQQQGYQQQHSYQQQQQTYQQQQPPYQQQQQPQYPPVHGLPPQSYGQPGLYPGAAPAGVGLSPARSPPPPMSQGGSMMPAASSRRRIYPEQAMGAYDSQQQQQHAPQYGHSGLPPLPGSGQHGMTQSATDPNAGQGAFFVPGAAQPPIISASATQGLSPQGYPGAQGMQPPGYPPPLDTQAPTLIAPQMADLSQQFSQMGVGPNPAEYQTVLLGGKPQLSALDEAPPAIKLPPNATCVPSPYVICPPNHKRSTLNAIPRTDKLLKKTKLPFGLVITPFKTQ
ncbi:COPII subunit, partial [Coemansia sp. RSA 2681]